MTDFRRLLAPDMGEEAIAVRPVGVEGFDAFLTTLSEVGRTAVAAAGYTVIDGNAAHRPSAQGADYVLVNLTANLHLDPMLQSVVTQLPHSLSLGGHYLTPEGLIRNGVLLVAVVAACRTLNGIIAKET